VTGWDRRSKQNCAPIRRENGSGWCAIFQSFVFWSNALIQRCGIALPPKNKTLF
jgi:hypothetical protein